MIDFGKTIYTPLVVSDKTIGVFSISSPSLTMEDRVAVSTFARQAGIALQNARLYEQAQKEIAERRQAEEELSRSEEHLRSVIENSPVPLAVNDEKQEIVFLNHAFTKTFGYDLNDTPNLKEWWARAYPDKKYRAWVAKTWQSRLDKAKNENKPFEPVEVDIQCKDGKMKTVVAEASPLKGSLDKIHLVSLYDITERKKSEQLLLDKNEEIETKNRELIRINTELEIAKNKAEESDKLKSAFLANMSHEIRTPMNAILGFTSLLSKPDLDGDKRQQYIKIIQKSGHRLLNIISEIIDISKIESGQMETCFQETNIAQQIENVYDLLKYEAENKKIHLSYKINLRIKENIIVTDGDKLYSILTNLVKNSIKYTDTGSIEFGCDKKGETIEFFVKDTGIGIPKERQEAIFERFIQADISDKQAKQGAGLGLSIAKGLVELLGGKIWVKSEPGKGSVFYFTLPSNAMPDEKIAVQNILLSVKTDNRINPEVPKLKILIVEDDEASKMLISVFIKEFGKEVIDVKTGVEAVEICRNRRDIDLILMDIQIPELNGYDATRQIRQFNKKVVIIAQTALGLSGDREKAIDAGCDDYISKPVDKSEFLGLIYKYFKE